MKTENPGRAGQQTGRTSTPAKQGATNPKKPNNDPDQTPNREVENVPRAKPGSKISAPKNKPGFKH
jgi:hypothetical protein